MAKSAHIAVPLNEQISTGLRTRRARQGCHQTRSASRNLTRVAHRGSPATWCKTPGAPASC